MLLHLVGLLDRVLNSQVTSAKPLQVHVALVWDPGDRMGVQARIKKLSDTHSEIGILLSQIEDLP